MVSSAGSSGVDWNDREIQLNLATFNVRAQAALTAIMAYHATRASAYAKSNAPWRDQTSNARNGLYARAERSVSTYRIIVGHGVEYGVWLEVRWSGRYAIIRPTIDHEGPEVMTTVAGLFAIMFRGGL